MAQRTRPAERVLDVMYDSRPLGRLRPRTTGRGRCRGHPLPVRLPAPARAAAVVAQAAARFESYVPIAAAGTAARSSLLRGEISRVSTVRLWTRSARGLQRAPRSSREGSTPSRDVSWAVRSCSRGSAGRHSCRSHSPRRTWPREGRAEAAFGSIGRSTRHRRRRGCRLHGGALGNARRRPALSLSRRARGLGQSVEPLRQARLSRSCRLPRSAQEAPSRR
jgi:hypothetical protein